MKEYHQCCDESAKLPEILLDVTIVFQIWGHGHCCRKKWTWVRSSRVWEEKNTQKNRDLICWSLLRGMSQKNFIYFERFGTPGLRSAASTAPLNNANRVWRLLPGLDFFCVTDQLTWLVVTDRRKAQKVNWIILDCINFRIFQVGGIYDYTYDTLSFSYSYYNNIEFILK